MKIIILGAGGIGSLVGCLLSRENEVLLVGKEAHVNEINKNGLKIKGFINENFKVKAETKIDNIDDDTLIVLATKAIDNKKTLNEIKHLIKKNNIILCLQNGFGNEDEIKEIVDCEVIRAIITAGTTFLEPGNVNCSNLGNVFLENSKSSNKIVEAMEKTGIKTEISEDIKDKIWTKLIVSSVMNTLTAIFKVKNGELSRCPELVKSIIDEAVSVANKEGLSYNKDEMLERVNEIIQASGENKSSMYQDILKGRKTDHDYMNNAIVRLGKKQGIECPVNESIVAMIKFLEQKD